jgi:hypothetical protein
MNKLRKQPYKINYAGIVLVYGGYDNAGVLPSVEKLHVNSICAPFGEAG